MRKYLVNLLILLTLAFNTLLGGDPRESFSSRAGKAARLGKWWATVFCRVASWFHKDHCEISIKD